MDDTVIKSAVAAYCSEEDCSPPGEKWWERLYDRLPPGVLDGVEAAAHDGAVVVDGWRFAFRRGDSHHQFFSRGGEQPAPNWEAFVHVALYGDLARRLEPSGYTVWGERDSMDITIDDQAGNLLWYVEVKEAMDDLVFLADGIAAYGAEGVSEGSSGRMDALSKAQDLVRYWPQWFSLAAIGAQLDFAVEYEDDRKFTLRRDLVRLPPS
jgi:hypothetical protein